MRSTVKNQILLILVLASCQVQARETISKIGGFELMTCNQTKKCIKLNATRAESGTLTPIMTLNHYSLEIVTDKRTQNLSGNFGYYDMQRNKIVLTDNSHRDLEINLRDLSEKHY